MKKIIFTIMLLFMLLLVGCDNSIYKVEFIVDGEVVSTQDVKSGDSAIAPDDPEKEGHIFIGWDKEYAKVKKNLTINAVFEKEEYTVIFLDEDQNQIKEETVKYKESATAPELELEEGYELEKWVGGDYTSVTEDMILKPVIKKIRYTVKFLDEDGTLLKEITVSHGNTASFGGDPKKSGYNFLGWDKDIKKVTSNMEVKAKFELATYTITYKDEEGNVINGLSPSSYTILDDASLELPALIEKEGYECLGWYEGNTRVVTFFSSDAVDKVYTLKYKELPKPLALPDDCTDTFKAVKRILHSSGTFYVYQPDFTGLKAPSTSVGSYTWSSLNPEVVTISAFSSMSIASPGFGIIKAVYNNDPTKVFYAVVKTTTEGIFISTIEEANTKIEYEVTFTDENGNVIETQKVEEGKSATPPTPPKKEGYTFIGWSGDTFGVTENLTLEPNYVEGESDFAGKTVSILGDSISTYKGYVPDGYSCFYPYPTADLADVNQTWWMQVINKLGMKLLKNNSYSGTCVSSGTGSYSTVEDNRLKELLFGTEAPDIIIIFMGSNDCGSAYVKDETFKSSYKVMLDKIKVLCPNSEIFIMTLPPSMLYKEANRVNYNKVIRDYANEYELPIVEMDNTYNGEDCTNFLVDSAHQNFAGMTKLAEAVIKGMLESEGITYNKE